MLPSLGQVREGVGFAGRLLNSPIVEGVVSYAGIPLPKIGADIKKTRSEEALKDPTKTPKGIVNWIRERVLTYGVVAGVITGIGSAICGRLYISNPEGNGRIGWLGSVLKLFSLGSIASSMFSQYKGWYVKKVNGELAWQRYVLGGKIPDLMKDPDMSELKKHHETVHLLRYNPQETTDITRVENDIKQGKRVKAFFIGGSGTGKTHTMDHDAMLIKLYEEGKTESEKKEVVLKTISGGKLTDAVVGRGLAGQVLDTAKQLNPELAQLGEQAMGLLKDNPQAALQTAIAGMIDEAEKAKEKGQRLVILIDEMDKIWKMAVKDGNIDLSMIGLLATQFQRLLEYPDLDILITGNGTIREMCFLDELKKAGVKDDQIPTELIGLEQRLTKIRVHMSEPTFETQSKIIASRLIELQSKLNKPYEEFIDSIILNRLKTSLRIEQATALTVSDENKTQVETKLAEIIYNDLYGRFSNIDYDNSEKESLYLKSDPELYVEGRVFQGFSGRLISDAIMEKYCSDITSASAKGQDKSKITISGLRQYALDILRERANALGQTYGPHLNAFRQQRYAQEISDSERKEKLKQAEDLDSIKSLRQKCEEISSKISERSIHLSEEQIEFITQVITFLGPESILKLAINEINLHANQFLKLWDIKMIDKTEAKQQSVLPEGSSRKVLRERLAQLTNEEYETLTSKIDRDSLMSIVRSISDETISREIDPNNAEIIARANLATINKALRTT